MGVNELFPWETIVFFIFNFWPEMSEKISDVFTVHTEMVSMGTE